MALVDDQLNVLISTLNSEITTLNTIAADTLPELHNLQFQTIAKRLVSGVQECRAIKVEYEAKLKELEERPQLERLKEPIIDALSNTIDAEFKRLDLGSAIQKAVSESVQSSMKDLQDGLQATIDKSGVGEQTTSDLQALVVETVTDTLNTQLRVLEKDVAERNELKQQLKDADQRLGEQERGKS